MNCRRLLLVLPMLATCFTCLPPPAEAETAVASGLETALDRYVQQPDDAYAWKIVGQQQDPRGRELVLELTSQVWRNADEVDRPRWTHWLIVVIPNNADRRTALLSIGGGKNGGNTPRGAGNLARQVALATGSVVAELQMVPNQPLEIGDDGSSRYEDNLLARSWREYLKTGDANWIGQLPMTKSAVRAMDAVQECLAEESPELAIERFVVTGGSKRGWTTWLAAAVDNRVAAIAPLVIDLLNIRESMRHHRAVYGFWSEALGDYERQGLAERLEDPALDELHRIVDPYHYRDRLTMPKCVINATGDEFFLPDSSRYYFDDLVGEKHLCYVPNTGHSLDGSNAIDTLIAFHHSVVHEVERPSVEWTTSDAGEVRVTTGGKPVLVRYFFATNPTARDFRRDEVGDLFFSRPIEPDVGGDYVVQLEAPAEGWNASFVQLTFDLGGPKPFRVTTPVWVTPDTEPFANE